MAVTYVDPYLSDDFRKKLKLQQMGGGGVQYLTPEETTYFNSLPQLEGGSQIQGIQSNNPSQGYVMPIQYDSQGKPIPYTPPTGVSQPNEIDPITGAPKYNPQGLSSELQNLIQPTDYGKLLLDGSGGTVSSQAALSPLNLQPTKLTDTFKPSTGDLAEKQFQDYLGRIQAPSSVEEVQKRLESDALKQTLEDIDRDTRKKVDDIKLSFLERGLGGVGQLSSIESIGLAQAEAEGARTKAGARTQLQLADLQRQREKERQVQEAYGLRYQTGVKAEEQIRGAQFEAAKNDVDAANNLLQLIYKTGTPTAEGVLDRQLQVKSIVAKLSSEEKMNTVNRLFEVMMQNSRNDLEREKIKADFELAYAQHQNAVEIQQMKGQGGGDFWGDMLQTIVGGVVGGFTGGVGQAIGDVAYKKIVS